MRSVRLKALIFFAAAAIAFSVAHVWRPTKQLSDTRAKVDLEQMFPQRIGAWTVDNSGPVQLISPDQKALLNKLYNQTLSRTYVNAGGERVMLSVAYGGDQSDGTSAHRPEVCYPAQGFDILASNSSVWQLPGLSLPIRQLTTRLGARTEPVSYWMVIGNRVVLGGTDQKIAQLSYTTRGLIPDGILIRVSTIDRESARAFGVQASFVNDMFEAAPAPVRERIFGFTGAPVDHGTAANHGSRSTALGTATPGDGATLR